MENWKSYAQSSLYIDPLTVLIGTNASGKSNALDAFIFLNRIPCGAMLTSALQGDGAFPPMRGGIEWAPQRPGKKFALEIISRADNLPDYEYRIACRISDTRCELMAERLLMKKYRSHNKKPTLIK